jgi:diguanylate cyclase (GGDEF)-like protein
MGMWAGAVGLPVVTGILHAAFGSQHYVLSLHYVSIVLAASCGGYLGGLLCASFATAVLTMVSLYFSPLSLATAALYVFFFYLFAFVVGGLREDRHLLNNRAATDSLTGVFNRHYFVQQLKAEAERCRRYGNSMSLLMVNVDHFKQWNDRLGHHNGDYVLREIAYILRSYVRASDTVCRYGGEEFAVILPELQAENALIVAEKLRKMVEDKVAMSLGLETSVTVSIGVADCCPKDEADAEPDSRESRGRGNEEGLDRLFERANHALHEAKKAGRNYVHVWGDLPPSPSNTAKVSGKVLHFEPRPSEWAKTI